MPQTIARRYLLLPHPGRPELLLLETPAGWTLPYVTLDRHGYNMAQPLISAVREQFGVTVFLLRSVYRHAAPPRDYADRVLAVANLSPDWVPPCGARWVGCGAELPLAVPEHAPLIAAWFAEATGAAPIPPDRPGWTDPAWVGDVSAWLDSLGIRRSGPIEQVKSWTVSCLLRIPTEAGDLYFKAVPAFFPTEAGVTAALAREFPDWMPQIVAVDPDRRWLLMRAFAGVHLEEAPDLARWEEALGGYARMQVSLVGQESRLLAAGCNDRRPAVMFAQYERLLADDAFLLTHFSAEEVDALRSQLPGLKALAQSLEARGIPYTLEHGDLHCRNVAAEPGAIRFFDWSDACIAHPFFSVKYFLDNRDDAVREQPGVDERLLAAYLEPWAPFASPADLRAAVDEAARLSHVHYALSYYWYILPLSDENWGATVADYLRELL